MTNIPLGNHSKPIAVGLTSKEAYSKEPISLSDHPRKRVERENTPTELAYATGSSLLLRRLHNLNS